MTYTSPTRRPQAMTAVPRSPTATYGTVVVTTSGPSADQSPWAERIAASMKEGPVNVGRIHAATAPRFRLIATCGPSGSGTLRVEPRTAGADQSPRAGRVAASTTSAADQMATASPQSVIATSGKEAQ